MTIYRSNTKQNEKNANYGIVCKITSEEKFVEATNYDHVCCKYKNGHRSKADFIECDCLFFDVDNTFSDDPDDWVSPDDLTDYFEDVKILVRFSRNHMKPKNGKEPRPKFHCYLPLKRIITDPAEFKAAQLKLLKIFPYLDTESQDIAHFLYSTTEGHQIIEGSTFINEFLQITKEEIEACRSDSADGKHEKFELPETLEEGARNSLLHKMACSLFFSGFSAVEVLASVSTVNEHRAEKKLPASEIKTLVASAERYYKKKKPSEESKAEKAKAPVKDIFSYFNFYRYEDITEEEKKPPEFIVAGLVPVGLTFLSGAPKIRKSFFSLQMAAAVAHGEQFLGHDTLKCSVAYFDLEGSKSRISSRVSRMENGLPHNLVLTNMIDCKLADGSLVERIRQLHREYPDFRLIIIDTFARAKGAARNSGGQSAYDQDMQLLEPLQRMAIDEGIAVVCVHHDKKGSSAAADIFERVNGTMGITGSCDSVLNLVGDGRRSDGKADLEYNPRDAVGGKIKLEFDNFSLQWKISAETEAKSDISGMPVPSFCIDHAPDRGVAPVFFSYKEVYKNSYKTEFYPDDVGDTVRKTIIESSETLFNIYHIGVQIGVKCNSERGIRIIRLM